MNRKDTNLLGCLAILLVSSTTSGYCASDSTDSCVDKETIDGYSDCTTSAYLCTNPIYEDFMKIQCPKTCGVCVPAVEATTAPTNVCVDKEKQFCDAQMHECKRPEVEKLMKDICPKTCGYCSTDDQTTTAPLVECVDIIDDCFNSVEKCRNPGLEEFMRINCVKTCGHCSADEETTAGLDATCADKIYPMACSVNLENCRNPNAVVFMRENCAKTCGYCSSDFQPIPVPSGKCEDGSKMTEFCSGITADNCKDPYLKGLLKEHCPQTCGFCSFEVEITTAPSDDVGMTTDVTLEDDTLPDVTTDAEMITAETFEFDSSSAPPSSCVDKNDEFCSSNVIYCTKSDVEAFMTDFCPKTCGSCL